MPTKIVISAKPKRRRRECESEHSNFRNWKELKTCSTRAEAQKMKEKLGRKPGNEAHPGGRKTKGSCTVCKFNYD